MRNIGTAVVGLFASAALLGCGTEPSTDILQDEELRPAPISRAQFRSVSIGETREQVEAKLGKPAFERDNSEQDQENPGDCKGPRAPCCIFYSDPDSVGLAGYEFCFGDGRLEDKYHE